MNTGIIITIAFLALLALAEFYMLYKAGQRINEGRRENGELRAECKKLTNALSVKEAELRLQVELQEQATATIRRLEGENKKLTEALTKEQAKRREAKLRKSVLAQGEELRRAEAKESKRQARIQAKKRGFKPHAINPHNPQKK